MNTQIAASSVQPQPTVPTSLKAERIQLWLQEMPGWKITRRGERISRHFQFRTRCESLSFLRKATQAIEATEVAFGLRGPVLTYRGDQVTVSIWSNRGVFSGPDLELARVVGQTN